MEFAALIEQGLWVCFLVISVLCLGLTLVQLVLQNYYSALPPQLPKKYRLTNTPLVSAHIPSYNEPATLLKNTIRALSKQKHEQLEVLILDNNTPDPKVWKPVAKYCRDLGKRFKFEHIDHLAGFKAGALNLMRQQTNPKAQYITTIDSDYETVPTFLSTALQYFGDPKVGFVQFPQAYFNANHRNRGIVLEYSYFFDTYMNAANVYHSVNATGTLTIFRKDVLDQIGHYNTGSITEDADIGYRFITAGYYGVFVNQVVGRGLMPYDIADYKKQKLRWATGNAVILKSFFTKELFDRRLNWKQKANLFAQLTAWLNFTLLPACIVMFYAGMLLLEPATVQHNLYAVLSVLLSSATIIIFLVLKFTAYYFRYLGMQSFRTILRAYLIHLSMYWIYASAGFRVLVRSQLAFVRTNKFILPLVPSVFKNTGFEFFMAMVNITLGLLICRAGYLWLGATLLVLGSVFALVYYFMWEVSTTKAASAHEMLDRIQPSFKN